ncbi:MAG TPA: hypothetical protein PK370_01130 [Candidatus Woesebacteria bacterium]|nr:hypothetical protein [Candidatus Woesebacteria bacterium]HPJ17484.1 hypothetical protein [Candidatus Woesebacteria bacterium]
MSVKRFHLNWRIVLLSLFSLAIFFSVKTIAQTTTENPLKLKQDAIIEGNNQEAWLNEALGSNLVSLFTGIVGPIPDEIFEGKTTSYLPGGALGQSTKMISSLFSSPASGIEYIAQVKDNFLGKPAYAQGYGTRGLQFLLPIWKTLRNLIYIFSAVVFLVVGLMIILRVKINPQTVISIQNAVPQIIIALVLVSFSYAIAGLLIDLSGVIQALFVALIFSSKGVGFNQNLFGPIIGNSGGLLILGDAGNALGALVSEVGSWIGIAKPLSYTHLANPDINTFNMLAFRAVPGYFSLTLLGGLLGSIIVGLLGGGILQWAAGGVGNGIGSLGGSIIGGAGGGLIGLIIIPIVLCIAVMIWLIKLYFGLLKTYVTIIFKIILAPIEIGMGAFPNSKMGFSSWAIDLIANLAVFPFVNIFLILLNYIMESINSSTVLGVGGSTVWAPNAINLGGTISPLIISSAIGLAGLSILSKLPELVPQLIFALKPSPWGQAIGDSLSKTAQPYQVGATQFVHDQAAARYATGNRDLRAGAGRLFADILESMGKARGH